MILEAEGEGNFIGLFLNIDNLRSGWYGEGDDMIFIDGEKWPTSYHGTGTEEIFSGGPCPNIEYAGPYTGYHLITNSDHSGKNSMYRFCVTDPMRFRKSIKVTLEHGHANNLSNDYLSVAFWYQKEPHKKFPHMLPVSERIPRNSKIKKKILEIRKEAENACLKLERRLHAKGDASRITDKEKDQLRKVTQSLYELFLAADREDIEKVSQAKNTCNPTGKNRVIRTLPLLYILDINS